MAIVANCFECGDEIELAVYNDVGLSGALLLTCRDCGEDTPEHNLWDASRLEELAEERDDWYMEEILEQRSPLDSDEEWTVLDRHRNREEELREEFGDDIPKSLDRNPDPVPEIFIRDPDDEEALAAARKEAREMIA